MISFSSLISVKSNRICIHARWLHNVISTMSWSKSRVHHFSHGRHFLWDVYKIFEVSGKFVDAQIIEPCFLGATLGSRYLTRGVPGRRVPVGLRGGTGVPGVWHSTGHRIYTTLGGRWEFQTRCWGHLQLSISVELESGTRGILRFTCRVSWKTRKVSKTLRCIWSEHLWWSTRNSNAFGRYFLRAVFTCWWWDNSLLAQLEPGRADHLTLIFLCVVQFKTCLTNKLPLLNSDMG